jgi:hypothetical protein
LKWNRNIKHSKEGEKRDGRERRLRNGLEKSENELNRKEKTHRDYEEIGFYSCGRFDVRNLRAMFSG